MRERIAPLAHSGWPYAALVAGVFLAALAAGYVYAHDPARDQVVLRMDRTPPPQHHRVISGTVIEASDDLLVLDSEGQRIEIALPPGAPIEELRRAGSPFPGGTAVNVGAEHTGFGLVLTGIVAVEDPQP